MRVLVVRGELDASTAPQLRRAMRAGKCRHAALLIDLTECQFIDSTGIALLVSAAKGFGEDAGDATKPELALCNPSSQVRRVIELTGLGHAIPVHESRFAALTELS